MDKGEEEKIRKIEEKRIVDGEWIRKEENRRG